MNLFINPFKPKFRNYALALLLLWGLYVVLMLLSPADQAINRYGISAMQLSILRFTVGVPYLVIWLSALIGVLGFREYLALIGDAPEREGFKRITKGIFYLLLAVAVPPFVSLVIAFNPESQSTVRAVRIITNYLTLAFYLGAFWHLLEGSKMLNTAMRITNQHYDRAVLVVYSVIGLLSVVYIWAVFHNPVRTVSGDPMVRPSYFLPDTLIILTIILPYIFVWLCGSLAIVNIRAFAKNVQGLVYRQAFSIVAWGLAAIIGLSILLQLLTQLGTFFGHSSLGVILLVVYGLLLAIAAGHIFIARGARALTAIERV